MRWLALALLLAACGYKAPPETPAPGVTRPDLLRSLNGMDEEAF